MRNEAEKTDASRPQKSASGYDIAPLPAALVDDLAKTLTADERHVLLEHGTERPFCGLLLDNKEEGIYACRLCGLPRQAAHILAEANPPNPEAGRRPAARPLLVPHPCESLL